MGEGVRRINAAWADGAEIENPRCPSCGRQMFAAEEIAICFFCSYDSTETLQERVRRARRQSSLPKDSPIPV